LNDKDKLASKELWEQKHSLLLSLGWNHWAQRVKEQIAQAFPSDFASI
jgi:hypothetical protein